MGDDVVELTEMPVGQLAHIALTQCQVSQPDRGRGRLTVCDRSRGQIDPERAQPGVAVTIAIRFPPAPQPISRTRPWDGSGGSKPCNVATVARRSGRVPACGYVE